MSNHVDPITVTPRLLATLPIPAADGTKKARGDVVVVGGSRRSPGAVQLAGVSALRVGAGRLTLVLGESVSTVVGAAVPEAGVVPVAETASGHVRGAGIATAADDLGGADAVLVGPGLDDIREARAMLRKLTSLLDSSPVVIDAYGLGALAGVRKRPRTEAVLTPNVHEAEILLGRTIDDLDTDCVEIARRYRGVVSCFGTIATPDRRIFRVVEGGPGLGTSGSGDVLAGAITGLLARGCDTTTAAVWGTYLHAQAGMALADRVGSVGFLARQISAELPAVLARATASVSDRG